MRRISKQQCHQDNIGGELGSLENNNHRGCTYKELLACNPKEYDGKEGVVVYTCLIEKMESIQGMLAAIKPSTIQKVMQIAGTLTDEALRNGSIKKNLEKRGNGGEPSKDRNGRDNNKRTRIGNAFATTANPIRREYTGTTPNVSPPVKSWELHNQDSEKAFMLGELEARARTLGIVNQARSLRKFNRLYLIWTLGATIVLSPLHFISC
ncbi:hypothetical protein Tco_0366956 [Tanacetum coccineum]